MAHIHFIGIGGAGMSGLAHVLLARGERVSGSDQSANAATARLAAAGATVYGRQVGENLAVGTPDAPDLVVVTAAVHEDNPELRVAGAAGLPVVSRAEFLGSLMAEHAGPRIAVAGTHGKTTTTAMAAEVLLAAGLDPTILIGGDYEPIGGNARAGGGLFLTEACEAYESFLTLQPDISVVTNVDADHLDHYGTEAGVLEAFRRFALRTAHGGCLVWCAADKGARALSTALGSDAQFRRVAYGFEPYGDDCLWATEVEPMGQGSAFVVWRRHAGHEEQIGSAHMRAPGRHNVLNALAAAAVALECGANAAAIVAGLEAFRGTSRRFEILGEADGVLVIDDYAHHPTEIRATLAAARAAYPDRRVIAIFQPHLYSRTRDFLQGFAESLAEADAVFLTEIYAAREDPACYPGVSVQEIVRRVAQIAPQKSVLFVPDKREIADTLTWVAHRGDVVLVMGAGDIREAGEQIVARGSEAHAKAG